MNTMPSYINVENLLVDFSSDSCAYIHGVLCGFVCVAPSIGLTDWLREVSLDDLNNAKQKELYVQLNTIFDNTITQLSSADINFQLFVAIDNCSLMEQAQTLADWCQGFLFGLGLSKNTIQDKEVLEVINSFSEISKLDTNFETNEENAQDLNQIVEFMRISVLLVQEILQPLKQNYVNPESQP